MRCAGLPGFAAFERALIVPHAPADPGQLVGQGDRGDVVAVARGQLPGPDAEIVRVAGDGAGAEGSARAVNEHMRT